MNERLQPNVADYAPVNDLHMYYEIHGSGQPLVLLHSGMTTIEDFGLMLPAFAQSCQVIAFERQGHGHTGNTLFLWSVKVSELLQRILCRAEIAQRGMLTLPVVEAHHVVEDGSACMVM